MKTNAITAIGRRKASTVRVFLKPGEGKITVNKRPFEEYFSRETGRMIVKQPLVLLAAAGTFDPTKYDIVMNATGGGMAGQAGAARLGISRALMKLNIELRPALKKEGYVTRDPRAVERKKYGHHKARKRPQFSKR